MSDDQINTLEKAMIRLETKWKSHGESSLTFRKDIKECLAIIQSDIKSMSEGVHVRKEECFDRSRKYTSFVVGLWLGIPVTVTSILVSLSWIYNIIRP